MGRRVKILAIFIFLVWIILIARVYFLSIKSSDYYAKMALSNAVKTEIISPTRGQILDKNNHPLAINRLGYSILLKPHLKDKFLDEEISKITEIFKDFNASILKKEYKKQNSAYNQDYIKVVDFIDYDDMIPRFSKINLFNNILIEPASKRHYPFNELSSHIIGYVGIANSKDIEKFPIAKYTNYVGRSGVEAFYNEILAGEVGKKITKVTALNKVVEELEYKKPNSNDIALHIDIKLQKFLQDLFKNKAGAVVIMDVKDGAIIGAGSYPEYNLNPFVTGISTSRWNEIINDLNHPFTNKLINGLYPPGSVIKMGVGMSFLNSGKITKDKSYKCSGYIVLGKRKFRCWKTWGHGSVDLNKAIRESCDVYFYEGSLEVGIDFIATNLERYGFGKKTNIDLPNEFIGTVPNKAWKMEKFRRPWYTGETVITSIGQGNFLVTPMQIAKHTAEIASGKGLTPHFLKSINGKDVKFDTYEIFTPFEKLNLPSIKKAMYEVANHPKGTSYNYLKDSIVKIAAKTGTAQVVGIPQSELVRMKESDMEYFHRSHSWITGFAPYDDPKYAVTVLVEHGGGGSSTGSPILKSIFEKLVEMGYIDLNSTK
ncbi:penicillin-binding protein 2 [Campylobacter sp. FMV-PI01]|uniref:Penicillin-binding protein 2 n=1 Tax=Campylobacter portucalensis TaxID=2608384 RepID=A0A6L5WFX3_9BACT|nr:penicillin-binding protein 2 [Campylobacter portucalensis]MSN96020.1 penicillin-binding protein 2 [Campylobacter portucalensis]